MLLDVGIFLIIRASIIIIKFWPIHEAIIRLFSIGLLRRCWCVSVCDKICPNSTVIREV